MRRFNDAAGEKRGECLLQSAVRNAWPRTRKLSELVSRRREER